MVFKRMGNTRLSPVVLLTSGWRETLETGALHMSMKKEAIQWQESDLYTKKHTMHTNKKCSQLGLASHVSWCKLWSAANFLTQNPKEVSNNHCCVNHTSRFFNLIFCILHLFPKHTQIHKTYHNQNWKKWKNVN
jgi:hypothetical protein